VVQRRLPTSLDARSSSVPDAWRQRHPQADPKSGPSSPSPSCERDDTTDNVLLDSLPHGNMARARQIGILRSVDVVGLPDHTESMMGCQTISMKCENCSGVPETQDDQGILVARRPGVGQC